MPPHPLPDRAVVRISGEDARKLLGDTLTCRFDDDLSGTGRAFALLTPQGKVQVAGLVTAAEGAFWFDLHGSAAADFVKRMKLYRLRAKVEIEAVAEAGVLWSPDAEWLHGNVAYRDTRAAGLGHRGVARGLSGQAGDDLPYARARIAAGVPEFGLDFASAEVFAHDVALDLLGGIDFSKGCYVGQEVVSRMKHRGTVRRRPVVVSSIASDERVLHAGGREAGIIGQVVEGSAIAIVRLDRIQDPSGVTVGGLPVSLTLPAYADYTFGGPQVD